MNILVVTDAYPPELRSSAELMRDLAVELRKDGHKVWVITSAPKDAVAGGIALQAGISEEDGVIVIRADIPQHHNVGFIKKGISWLRMPHHFWKEVKKTCRHIDAVIVHSPPLPLAKVAKYAKKKYGAKYILNVQDIFPQNAIDLGVLKNPLLVRFFERMEQRAYKECDVIVTPSYEHKEYLAKERNVREDKVHVIHHWVDPKPFAKAKNTGKFRKQFGLEDKFIFFFGGVVGPSQGLDILIHMGKRLKKDYPNIVFLVCGDGSEKERLENIVNRSRIENVRFEKWVSKEEYRELIKEVDVGVISLVGKNTTPAVPAKLMGYMAAGIPAIGFLHEKSEARKIIEEARCGLGTLYDDEDACLDAVVSMYKSKKKLHEYGENALGYVEENLTPEKSIAKWEQVL
ncbi:hypothetical protein CL629_04565 [bacterium]|nr:hypothetical protein [bacterium]